MSKLLTVGISTHGSRRPWLQDVVDSMYHFNNGVEFDLVIVDNASEDDTARYLDRLGSVVNLSVITNLKNLDDTIAMNQILATVSSDYFLKVDSDVIFFEHGCIRESISHMESLGVSMLGPYWDLSLTRKKEIYNWFGYEKSKRLIEDATVLAQSVNSHFEVTMRLPRGNYLLMKTSDIVNVGCFDENYRHNAMEYPLAMKLIEFGFDYSEYNNQGVIHKPTDEQRLIMRESVPYMF